MSTVTQNVVRAGIDVRRAVLERSATAGLESGQTSATETAETRAQKANSIAVSETSSPIYRSNEQKPVILSAIPSSDTYGQKRRYMEYHFESDILQKRLKEEASFSSSIAVPHYRRPSWEMDIVKDEEHDYGFTSSLSQLKPGADRSRRLSWMMDWESLKAGESHLNHYEAASATGIIQPGENCIQYAPLYYDVSGPIPEGHEPLIERDIYNIPLTPAEHDRETERALMLTLKPILNAPPWFENLPWDDMEDISLEEFIIFFPNHAARWPGIALWLRCQNWDRLFYRAARLINLARGAHHVQDRNDRRVEVLPLMSKVQAAIQELAPQYELANHDTYTNPSTLEFARIRIKDKPLAFPSHSKTVKLETAAGYCLGGVNEFEHRPFSQKMLKIQQRFRSRNGRLYFLEEEKAPVPKFPFAEFFEDISPQPLRRSGSGYSHVSDQIDREPAASMTSLAAPSPSPPATAQSLYQCANLAACDDVDYPFGHKLVAEATEELVSRRKREDPQPPGKANKICRDSLNCERDDACRFLHVGDEGYQQALVNQLARQSRRQDSGNAQQPQSQNTSQKQRPSRPEGENDTQQGNSQPLPRALCRHSAKCNKPDCPFGHRSPAADESVTVNLKKPCRFGMACSNLQCNRTHPSPARANEQGQAGGSVPNNDNNVPRNGDQSGSKGGIPRRISNNNHRGPSNHTDSSRGGADSKQNNDRIHPHALPNNKPNGKRKDRISKSSKRPEQVSPHSRRKSHGKAVVRKYAVEAPTTHREPLPY